MRRPPLRRRAFIFARNLLPPHIVLWIFWSQTSLVGPSGGKGIRLNHAKNATGRFWCGLTPHSCAGQNDGDARVSASASRCRRSPVSDYGRLTGHFEASCHLLEGQQTKLSEAGAGQRSQGRKDCAWPPPAQVPVGFPPSPLSQLALFDKRSHPGVMFGS